MRIFFQLIQFISRENIAKRLKKKACFLREVLSSYARLRFCGDKRLTLNLVEQIKNLTFWLAVICKKKSVQNPQDMINQDY